MNTAKMSAMASPFRIPEDPYASTDLDKDIKLIEETPGYQPTAVYHGRITFLTLTYTRHMIINFHELIGLNFRLFLS